jgi:hypothetical protein
VISKGHLMITVPKMNRPHLKTAYIKWNGY